MRYLTKKILSKFIHPAIVMLLEQREQNPEQIGEVIPGFDYFTWLEKKLLNRQLDWKMKDTRKKEKQKRYERIMSGIINPPEPEKDTKAQAIAQAIAQTKAMTATNILQPGMLEHFKEIYDNKYDPIKEQIERDQYHKWMQKHNNQKS